MDESLATAAADRLRRARLARLRAEADELLSLTQLAQAYRVGEEQLVDMLMEQFVRVGAEGTPQVSELLALEVAGLLGCSPTAATHRLAEAVNLRWRHPTLWLHVQNLTLEPYRARRAATLCAHLPAQAAEEVGARWAARQGGLGWRAAQNLLQELIVQGTPDVAAQREESSRRSVHVWPMEDGTTALTALLDPLDAQLLDATVSQIAGVLGDGGVKGSRDQLRAKALGVMAVPALALRLQQQALQQPLVHVTGPDPLGLGGLSPAAAADCAPAPLLDEVLTQVHDAPAQQACLGHACGTVTVDPQRLLPPVQLVVHADLVDVQSMLQGDTDGSAWVEGMGAVTLEAVAGMLDGKRVKVQPVINLNDVPAEDQYVPSTAMARAVRLLHPQEAFPYSGTSSRRTDLDHTIAYRAGPPGQTRLGNLAPLSRRTHRAKTMGAWRYSQPRVGSLEWRSPLGYKYVVTPSGTVPGEGRGASRVDNRSG